jgi:hypothetical protein
MSKIHIWMDTPSTCNAGGCGDDTFVIKLLHHHWKKDIMQEHCATLYAFLWQDCAAKFG